MSEQKLIPNIDYYIDPNGNLVFTKAYHLKRGHCCYSGCLHCPYNKEETIDPNIPLELRDVWDDESYIEEDERDEQDD